MWFRFLQKIVKVLDPKLEKYREGADGAKNAVKTAPKYTPETLADFVGVIKRTPKSVLSTTDRERIAAIMSFDERKVADLMVDKSKMVFVKADEMLGPLMLDKLYKSGFTNFPVINTKEKVVGILHTEALNTLEIRKMDKAEKYIDKNVSFLQVNDTLKKVVDEIERTNSYYFLVRDEDGKLRGFLTAQMIFDYLSL